MLIRASHCVFHRYLHQQHICDDVQKGQLWNCLHSVSSCHQGIETFLSFSSSLLLLLQPTLDMTLCLSCSMILGLGMLSGTAVSLAWWIICWGWWAAGPLSAAFGTCRRWTKRWKSLSQPCWITKISDTTFSSSVYSIHWRTFSTFSQPVLFYCLHVGGGGCGAVCQQGESSHSCTRRISGSHLVSH